MDDKIKDTFIVIACAAGSIVLGSSITMDFPFDRFTNLQKHKENTDSKAANHCKEMLLSPYFRASQMTFPAKGNFEQVISIPQEKMNSCYDKARFDFEKEARNPVVWANLAAGSVFVLFGLGLLGYRGLNIYRRRREPALKPR